jgi:small multidrug resistance family-3 protein
MPGLTVVVRTVALFMMAAVFELGGCYLAWKWWRQGGPVLLGIAGGVVLFGYGIIQTYQPADFARAYAAYGGVFIASALAWGWLFEGLAPDRFDLSGAAVALVGAGIIMFAPRG